MNRLEALKTLCKSRGISINKLEQELGFSQGSLGKIDTNVPKADKIYALANYFNVPMELFFDEEWEKNYSAKMSFSNDKVGEIIKPPLYHVAAGEGAFNDIYPDEYKDCESDDEYCWCKVEGDSMYPFLMDGDQIRVELTTDICQSDFTVVKVDGEHATVKHVEITKDGVWLRAINKEVYEDHFYSTHEVMTLPVTIVGKVVRMERHL